jgi:nitrogen regulatory protein P-II 1
MKKVEAIFRKERLEAVTVALKEQRYPGVTVSDVQGHGQSEQNTSMPRGKTQEGLSLYVRLEIVVRNDDAYRIASAIARNARTDRSGDGKIFISPIEGAIRIRTGEEGQGAI